MIARIASLLRIKVPDKEPSGLLIASGKGLPADGSIGYQPGCLFLLTDGGIAARLYVNEGCSNSADFDPVYGLTAEQKALLESLNVSITELNKLAGLTANSAQINQLDLVTKTDVVAEASKADGITAGSRYVKITGGTGFTGLVLPLPTAAEVGMVKQITLDTKTGGTVTMTLTDITVGGTAATTATFNNVGDSLVLIGKVFGETYRWSVVAEDGVVLS